MALNRSQISQPGPPFFGNLKAHTSTVSRVWCLVNEATLQEFVGYRCYEGAAKVKMLRNAIYTYVAFVNVEMAYRDQHSVFDADKPNPRAMTSANSFMARKKCKQPMYETAEGTVRTLDKQFRARNRQWRGGTRFLVGDFNGAATPTFGTSLAGRSTLGRGCAFFH